MAEPENAKKLRWWSLGVMLLLAGYFCFLILRPFFVPMLTGSVMAIAFYPIHVWIRERLHRPSLAALLSTLLILIAFAGPLTYVVTVVIRESRQAYQSLGPDGLGQGAEQLWSVVQGPLDRVASRFDMSAEEIRANVIERVRETGGSLLGQSFSIIGAVGGGVLSGIVALVSLYFALKNGRHIYKQAVLASPLGPDRTARLLNVAAEMVEASVYGVLAVAVAQGTLLWIGVWMAGLGSPALWGLAAAVGSVIPMVGSALAWVPAAILLFAQGSIGWGIFMVIWGAGVVGTIDNIIRPWVVSSRRPTNPLLVFVVILGAVQAFGVIGVLAGPVILAVTVALFEILREELKESTQDGPQSAQILEDGSADEPQDG